MNLELLPHIRESIATALIAVSNAQTPEATRTALQTHLDALLKEELQALTGQASHTPIYERLWCQATRDLDAAMDLVQRNSEFFGAQVGDDKIKVIGEFFVKWAPVMMKPGGTPTVDTNDLHAELCRIQAAILELKVAKYGEPTPWYPDDSGEWVEVPDDCTVCPLPDGTFVHYLLRSEREGKGYAALSNPADGLNWDLEPEENGRIVAYKAVNP